MSTAVCRPYSIAVVAPPIPASGANFAGSTPKSSGNGTQMVATAEPTGDLVAFRGGKCIWVIRSTQSAEPLGTE
ncbi:MAG: hypothetical protein M0019_07115 [Actinomycetota bacterium]|nr:hypothetical protein [Actinomycetota bacterium]